MALEIRLGCRYCDTQDADGVAEIPPGWVEVEQIQSYAASLEEIPVDDPSRSPFEWYTHLGTCPQCRKVYQ